MWWYTPVMTALQEAEARGLPQVQSQPGTHSKFKAKVINIEARTCLKTNKQAKSIWKDVHNLHAKTMKGILGPIYLGY